MTTPSVQPPTSAGKRRLAIFKRFIAAQFVILTTLVVLTVEGVLPTRWLGIIGIANFVISFLILWLALKHTPITEPEITREQRLRAIKGSKILIAVYLFALVNALFDVRGMPWSTLAIGIAINLAIVTALIVNLRKQQAKLKAMEGSRREIAER